MPSKLLKQLIGSLYVETHPPYMSQEMSNLSAQELTEICKTVPRDQCREAWNEFFTRFGPLLREAIEAVLRKKGWRFSLFAEDDETLWDIYELLVIKFYKGGALNDCRNTKGILPWLRTVAANQARDWIRGKETEENLPETEARKVTGSLDETLSGDTATTRGDLQPDHGSVTTTQLPDPEQNLLLMEQAEMVGDLLPALAQLQERRNFWSTYLDSHAAPVLTPEELSELAALCHLSIKAVSSNLDQAREEIALDRRKFWVLRLGMMASEAFDSREVEALADYCRMPVQVVLNRIEGIAKELAEKGEARKAELGKAELYRHQMLRLARKLRQAEDRDDRGDVDRIAVLIDNKAAGRESLLQKGRRSPRPSNRDIAFFVGLPQDQENQVTTILSRAQEKLWDGWTRALVAWDQQGASEFELTRYLCL